MLQGKKEGSYSNGRKSMLIIACLKEAQGRKDKKALKDGRKDCSKEGQGRMGESKRKDQDGRKEKEGKKERVQRHVRGKRSVEKEGRNELGKYSTYSPT